MPNVEHVHGWWFCAACGRQVMVRVFDDLARLPRYDEALVTRCDAGRGRRVALRAAAV